MKTVYSEDHVFHEAAGELDGIRVVPPNEVAARAETVLRTVQEVGLGEVVPPDHVSLDPVLKVHDAAYLRFLETVHREWRQTFGNTDAVPHAWSCRTLRQVEPKSLLGRLGYYSYDHDTPITAGTWHAALTAARVAITGQRLVGAGERAVFALTRPPGHHAARDVYGGYCFINNAAVAAQAFLDGGAGKVAVLDVDYHHGNGTQSIFYDRADVLFVSLHADPAQDYPYFLGYADEEGDGEGAGYNRNYPLPLGTTWRDYLPKLDEALRRIADYGPDFAVVSLGVDTLGGDPISGFRFELDDFHRLGNELSRLGRPTLFVMEGGYANDRLGTAVTNVLTAFEAG